MKAGSSVLQRVRPPGMITALARQHAAMAIEISKQLAPLLTKSLLQVQAAYEMQKPSLVLLSMMYKLTVPFTTA